MSYSNILFSQAGIAPKNLTLASTVMSIANVFASLGSSRVVDRWGRRTLLLGGTSFQAIAMLALYLVPGSSEDEPMSIAGPLTVACFTLFVTSFSVGLGGV